MSLSFENVDSTRVTVSGGKTGVLKGLLTMSAAQWFASLTQR